MNRLRLLDDGVIYRNPDPGFKAECAFLPNVVPLGGDEVICIYRIGQAFYSTDGTLNVARSLDGGRTWAQEGRVWDVMRPLVERGDGCAHEFHRLFERGPVLAFNAALVGQIAAKADVLEGLQAGAPIDVAGARL